MNNIILYIFIFIFGLIIGSFLNVVIWRLHKEESILTKTRSYCVKCRHKLGIRDLVPLFSFIFLRGKCRFCKKKISWQYPLVELTTGILFVLVILKYSIFNIQYLFDCNSVLLIIKGWVFACFLIIIFVYDLKYYLILDKVTVPAMILAVVLNLILGIIWWKLLLAAIIGGGFFWLQYVISKGKWVGGGDIRLGVLMGLMLAWPQIITALFFAYVTGAIIGVGLITVKKKTMKSAVPMGTFLTIGTVIALLYGEQVLNWYLNFLY